MKIGQKLKALRQERGLTQVELAKKSGVSRAVIQLYEADKTNITISILEKIAKVLNVEVSFFVSQCLPICPSMSLSPQEEELIKNFRILDKEERELYADEIRAKARRTKKAAAKTAQNLPKVSSSA